MRGAVVVMTSEESKSITRGLWSVTYICLMVINFGANVSFYLISSILSTYSIQLGASKALSGLIVGCFSIVALVARPFGGVISNRWRSTLLLVLSFLGMATAALGYALIQTPVLFLPFRVVHGVAFSINGVVTMVLMGKVLPKEHMTKGVAYFGVSQVLASAVGPTIGSACGRLFGYRVSFIVAACTLVFFSVVVILLSAAGKLTVSALTKTSNNGKPRLSVNELIDAKLIRLVAFSALFSAFNGLCSSYIINIGNERNIPQIALYFTVNSISIIVVRFLCGNFAERFKSVNPIMLITLFTASIGCSLIGASHTLILFCLAAFIQAFSHGFAQPAVQAEALKCADSERMGTSSSTFFMSADIGQGLGVMIGGAVSGVLGYDGMFYVMAGVFIVAIPLYYLINMRQKRATEAV